MKLSYVVTNGNSVIVAEQDDGRICELDQYYFGGDGFTEPDLDDPEFDSICREYLKKIAEYNSFDELFGNWTADEPDNFPHTSSAEYDADPNCFIAAQYIVQTA